MTLDELVVRLDKFSDKIIDECVEAFKEVTPIGATGDLQDSIRVLEKGADYAVIGTDLYYAKTVNEGRPEIPGPISWWGYDPGNEWSIHKPGDAGVYYKNMKRSGPAKPNPFRERALNRINKLKFEL